MISFFKCKNKENNVKAHTKEATIVFSMDKLETTQEKKRDGTSKEEESHAITPRRNREKGKKNVHLSSI
jgi:hypothetical protein